MGCWERLLREDHPRTKHDAAFSAWKVLIGSSDWEDHKLGMEGVERYRVHNLPRACSSAGIYELGIVGTTLDPDYIVVVYIGQADSVRTRLQKYGRFGAHLETSSGLFTQIFSRGYSIAFRWAPMQNKQEAEKTELQLLTTFDYAWNKGSNNVRRVHEVLRKLDSLSSTATWLPKFVRRLQILNHRKVGIKIETTKTSLIPPRNAFHACTDDGDKNGDNFMPKILKFGRSRPTRISISGRTEIDSNIFCGVYIDGSDYICKKAPVKGRMRCAEHKGMKICRSVTKIIAEEKLKSSKELGNPPSAKDELLMKKEEVGVVCGVKSGLGSVCESAPVKGRRRCEEHKGMRVKKHGFGGMKKEKKNVRGTGNLVF